MTFKRKEYLIFGSREIWLREQKEAQLKRKKELFTYVKGHYRIINGKRIFIKSFYRKKKGV